MAPDTGEKIGLNDGQPVSQKQAGHGGSMLSLRVEHGTQIVIPNS